MTEIGLLVVAPRGLDGQGLELQELQRAVLAVVARREAWLELDWPDDATEIAGKRTRRAVGHNAVGEGGAELAPRGGDVLDGAVVAIPPALDVNTSVRRGSLHD